jgi:SAM-dependent methyltransferase
MQPSETADCQDLVAALRRGELEDEALDVLYPPEVGAVSGYFWPPVRVAQRAGEIFAELEVRRLLDVGSGPGKFCHVAAAIAPATEFTGIEQRPQLVEVASNVAARLGLENVRFGHGDATEAIGEGYDALYFFNPFAENMFAGTDRYDTTVELSEARMFADVRRVERALSAAPQGIFVLTYHGFGGKIPDSFDLFHAERVGTDWLRVWRKARKQTTPGRYFIELDDRVAEINWKQRRTRATES